MRYAANPSFGIDENETLKVSVFPNPANDFITINTEEVIEKITILDVSGKTVFSQEKGLNKRVNIQHLPSGVYFLTVESSNSVGTTKFIK
jgi:hypothetical protein